MYAGETFHRALASPRQADISTGDHVSLEVEITRVLDTMVLLEQKAHDTRTLLHWILLSRCLLTGNIDKSDEEVYDKDVFTRGRVVMEAKTRATASALHIFEFAAPVRWQVRCQAARSATLALQSISKESTGSNTAKSQHFDSMAAQVSFAKQCKDFRESQTHQAKMPSSFVVFHAGEVLSSACSSAVATLDQSELWHVQEGGVRLLTEVISCIGDVPDFDEPGQPMMEQYMSQIVSCIKHALTASQDDGEDEAQKLFILGCEALQAVVQNGLVTEPMTLKRLIRPILLSGSDLQFFDYGGTPTRKVLHSEEDSPFRNLRLSLLPLLGRLWTLGKLRAFLEDGILCEAVATALLDEMSSCRSGAAAYSAAIAIDGARLLRGTGLSLRGVELNADADESSMGDLPNDAGFLFDDYNDLDGMVKAVLVQAWPACACNAMFNLIDILQDADASDSERAACAIWLEKLIPIIFAGLRDSFPIIGTKAVEQDNQGGFASGILTAEVVAMCLRGLCALLQGLPNTNKLINICESELAVVVTSVSSIILFPAAGLKVSSDEDEESCAEPMSPELVMEACRFLEVLAASGIKSDAVEAALLLAVLTPLNALQKGDITFDDSLVATVIPSCLKVMQQLVMQAKAQETLVKAMLQLSVEILSGSTAQEAVRKAAKLLMADCLSDDAIPVSLHRDMAREMAVDCQWEPWAIICSHSSNGQALSNSLAGVKAAMKDVRSVDKHLPALSAVRRVTQEVTVPSVLIDIVMQGVGAQVLGLLKAYGTLSIPAKEAQNNRITGCADSMKIIMIAYQNLLSADNHVQLAAFLSVVFEALTSVIAYNGLPNQASPQPGADPTLGRLSAQAIVHVARTSPVAFKESMATLSDQGRALLEFSFRGEMNGYASVTQAPVKKKLNLQGFTK